MSLRTAWSAQQVPEQPGLYNKLSKANQKDQEYPYTKHFDHIQARGERVYDHFSPFMLKNTRFNEYHFCSFSPTHLN